MLAAVYRNFAGCFQRVLIDGGVHRIFKVEDKQIFEEDFCAIKAEVVSQSLCGLACLVMNANCTCPLLQRQHRFESLVDVDAIERLFALLAMTTPNLVDFYDKTERQGSSVEGDLIWQPDTILRIISHRDDRKGARRQLRHASCP